MAKRKSRRATKKPPKKQMKLETLFSCPFCDHPNTVDCTIDKELRIGEASCWVCEESYATRITALTEPIDIYYDWVDECRKVNGSKDDAGSA